MAQKSTVNNSTNKKSFKNPFNTKKRKIIGGVVGFFIFLFILAMIFGSPTSKAVFKDMSEEMLQVKSVTVDQDYKVKGTDGQTVNMKSKMFLDLSNSKEVKAAGKFTLDLVTNGVPLTVGADFIQIGDAKYVKFSELSSSSSTYASTFSQIESKLKNNWIKSRSGDTYGTFATFPLESISSALPTPFAYLSSDQQKNVLAILNDKGYYTIGESSKVEIGGVDAYKYSVQYNKDMYEKLEKALAEYTSYYKVSDETNTEMKTLNVWVDISTKRIVKIELQGTNKEGSVEGTILFSDYNKSANVTKPDDYSIESELLN